MEAVYKLWEGSWRDDAVVQDEVFVDPSRVRPVEHRGKYYRIRDIAVSEPSVQRTPVLFQAGTSPAGIDFASRHAEGVFISTYEPRGARTLVDRFRAAAAAHGRTLKIFTIATVVVAETDEEARAKYGDYAAHASWEGGLARWSGMMHLDLGALDPDKPLEYVDTEGIRGLVEVFTTLDPTRAWTPRAIGEFVGVGGGGPVMVGSPATVADELERWMDEADVDGFNIADPVPPAGHRDFVNLVVPELRRRGRVWPSYEGKTFRERFTGRPRIGADHPAYAYRWTP